MHLVEEGILLLDPEPRLEARRGVEGLAGLGAGVGRDGLPRRQAGLAQDQHVLPPAEGVLFVCSFGRVFAVTLFVSIDCLVLVAVFWIGCCLLLCSMRGPLSGAPRERDGRKLNYLCVT